MSCFMEVDTFIHISVLTMIQDFVYYMYKEFSKTMVDCTRLKMSNKICI